MGTAWLAAYVAPELDPEEVRARIIGRLAAFVAELSHWEPVSLLSRFNALPAGEWMALPADFAAVIAAGLDMAALSNGAFDPTIGRVVDLLGFGPSGLQAPPSPEALTAARTNSGYQRLAFDRQARRLRQPGGLSLDFSGIAKGHAVDMLGDFLTALGARDWLVEIGGELKGSGMRPDADPWWVDCEDPPGATLPPLRIALHGLAIATSGDYRRGSHTIDPRSGAPAANDIHSVSVIHAKAMLADAWATTLTVLGVDAGLALAAKHGIAARIVAAAEEHLTPAFLAMLTD
ncbi:thiamine biosynthesis lipoprotein [Sphingomonas vulcanisoli]|uniref:FAD:protein FMN transferase n=1 Tax=Sphingomonas vulcanisoli TaxID=1658060 RepID=A0ABX0TU03_9SPHN|nr:FAD:protein FMN transferase [Sphingomonas vulcanisoli]NIJ07061.1 thiamine biosynthesis lipoprotein [Sphingomonas vulcanisoli]